MSINVHNKYNVGRTEWIRQFDDDMRWQCVEVLSDCHQVPRRVHEKVIVAQLGDHLHWTSYENYSVWIWKLIFFNIEIKCISSDKRRVIVNGSKELRYDRLYLFCGLQYDYSLKVGLVMEPSNVFLMNTVQDVKNLMNKLVYVKNTANNRKICSANNFKSWKSNDNINRCGL